MLDLDPERWIAAVDATEWHRSQVQSFLYRVEGAAPDTPEGVRRAGAHVVRDCTLDPGKQELFRRIDLTGEWYDEITAEMRDLVRVYETTIVLNAYNAKS